VAQSGELLPSTYNVICHIQSLVATAVGVQKITGIGVADTRDGKPYDTLAATEVHFICDPQLLNLLFPTFGLSLSFEVVCLPVMLSQNVGFDHPTYSNNTCMYWNTNVAVYSKCGS
jgi:hypothetical protein